MNYAILGRLVMLVMELVSTLRAFYQICAQDHTPSVKDCFMDSVYDQSLGKHP